MSNLPVTSAAAVAVRPRTRKPYGRALLRMLVVNPIKSVGNMVSTYWRGTGSDGEDMVAAFGIIFGSVLAIVGLWATSPLPFVLCGLMMTIPGDIAIAGAFARRLNAEVERIMED